MWRLPCLRTPRYTDGKEPWEKLEGKHAPVASQNIQPAALRERVAILWTPSKYLSSVLNPGPSLYRACCFWINPWPLFKPGTTSGCSADPSRGALLNQPCQQDPYLWHGFQSQPGASVLSSVIQQRWHRILISTPSSWRRPPHLPRGSPFLGHSIFSYILYHRLSFPVEQAGETFFPGLSICFVSDSNL